MRWSETAHKPCFPYAACSSAIVGMNLTSLLLLNSRHYFGMHPAPHQDAKARRRKVGSTPNPRHSGRASRRISNLALRHGGGRRLASIEAEWDRLDVIAPLQEKFTTLGLGPGTHPLTSTARGGVRHYFALSDAPTDKNTGKMADVWGGGEAKWAKGTYTIAPPSKLSDGGLYELLAGTLAALPVLTFADLAPLLKD